MAFYFLGYEVEFLPRHHLYGKIPGALASVIVNTDSLEEARKVVRQVFAQDWIAIVEEQHARETTLEFLRDRPLLARMLSDLRELGIGLQIHPYEQNPLDEGAI